MIEDIVQGLLPSSGNGLKVPPDFSQLLHTSCFCYIYCPWVFAKKETNSKTDSNYPKSKSRLKINRPSPFCKMGNGTEDPRVKEKKMTLKTKTIPFSSEASCLEKVERTQMRDIRQGLELRNPSQRCRGQFFLFHLLVIKQEGRIRRKG